MTIDEIATVLQIGLTSAIPSERTLHEGVRHLIGAGRLPFAQHEARLEDQGDSPRLDFWFAKERIGLECKIAGNAGQIVRQLYTYEPYVDGLILLTTRRFPIEAELFEKPFRQVVLFHQ
jgi:hypothetical protein